MKATLPIVLYSAILLFSTVVLQLFSKLKFYPKNSKNNFSYYVLVFVKVLKSYSTNHKTES